MIAAGDPIPARVKVVAIGCGLGQDRQGWHYLESVIASRALMVCDADALNLLAAMPELVRAVSARGAPTILTPHPLEAARLLAIPTGRVQSDRVGAAVELARRFNAVTVLKGAGTVVAHPLGHYAINASGNPVLATGGTGDVLAGVIAALAARPLAGGPGRALRPPPAPASGCMAPQVISRRDASDRPVCRRGRSQTCCRPSCARSSAQRSPTPVQRPSIGGGLAGSTLAKLIHGGLVLRKAGSAVDHQPAVGERQDPAAACGE